MANLFFENNPTLEQQVLENTENIKELNLNDVYDVELNLDEDYKFSLTLKNKDDEIIVTSNIIDFPTESFIVNASYDNVTKEITFTLENGNTLVVPIGDIISGLQEEITADNMLSADLVDDTDTTNKFVTDSEKTTWNGKQNALTQTQLDNIDDVPNKLTKVTLSNKIYATDSNGDQTTLEYQSSQALAQNKIVQRDSNGDIRVMATPIDNNSAVSRQYVDNEITNLQNQLTPTEWQTPTINSTYISDGIIKYCEIGNIVILKMYDVKFTQQAINDMGNDNNAIIISGLPLGTIGVYRIIGDGDHTLKIGNMGNFADGQIRSWWSSPYSTTTLYYGEIIYVKNKYIN